MTDGALIAETIIVADQGLGFFNQSGGTVTASSGLILGNQATPQSLLNPGDPTDSSTVGGPSNGTYTLTGGTLTVDAGSSGTVQADTIVAANGSGTFVNDGGTHTTDALVIGQEFGSTGIYTLDASSTLNIIDSIGTTGNGFLDVGEYGGATYEQDGGTATLSGPLDAGRYTTGIGTVNIHGGTLTVGTFAGCRP